MNLPIVLTAGAMILAAGAGVAFSAWRRGWSLPGILVLTGVTVGTLIIMIGVS